MAPAYGQGKRGPGYAHYQQARQHEKNQRFKEAAAEYLEAYRKEAHPLFQFNAANAYQLAGDLAAASTHFKRYLKLAPKGVASAEARARISELEKVLEARRRGAVPIEELDDFAAGVGRDLLPTPQGGDPSVLGGRGYGITSPKSRGSRILKITGLSSAGAGMVALSFGMWYGFSARGQSDEITGATAWTPELLGKFTTGPELAKKAVMWTSVGALGIVAGGALYLLGSRKQGRAERHPQRVSIAPVWTRTSSGLAIQGQF